jgi:2,3-diphosphopglycerate-independent phosphoglycerate mutase
LVEHISGTDPLKDNLPLLECVPMIQDDSKAVLACKVVNAVHLAFKEILEKHPINIVRAAQGKTKANVVLFRGCGSMPNFPPFSSLHDLKAFMIAPCCIIAGIGEALGMTLVKVPGCTGRRDSDFKAKFDTAYRYLFESQEYFQFGFVHIKAVDEASHNGEPVEKKDLLGKIDEAFSGFVKAAEGKDFICVVTGDHTTPSSFHHDHTHHPVPFMIYTGNSAHADRVKSFDEFNVASGSLGHFTGQLVMPLIKHFIHK